MREKPLRPDFKSNRHIGDLKPGDLYHHGAVQITPFRNREYVKKFGEGKVAANPAVSGVLGCADPDAEVKREKFGIETPALVSRGFLFNIGFGLSVHDISFNAVANLSYSRLVFGSPVYEGDTVFARSEVLGVEFRKDAAASGSVQVETVVSNQRGETVLSYVRQVLVRAKKGETHAKSSSVKPQPAKAVPPENSFPPPVSAGLLCDFAAEKGKTFESLKTGDTVSGSFESGITLADFSWLQIATLNDAAVHHTPASVFIGYGGAVKAFCEGAVAAHFPFAFHLGMNSGAHNAPTYPSDIVRELYAEGQDGEHEKIRAFAEIMEKSEIPGRSDFGIVTVRLCGEKRVTEAGMKALEKARFSGTDKIFKENGNDWIRVLTLEQILAVPTEKCF